MARPAASRRTDSSSTKLNDQLSMMIGEQRKTNDLLEGISTIMRRAVKGRVVFVLVYCCCLLTTVVALTTIAASLPLHRSCVWLRFCSLLLRVGDKSVKISAALGRLIKDNVEKGDESDG
jgi:hypothetical protein